MATSSKTKDPQKSPRKAATHRSKVIGTRMSKGNIVCKSEKFGNSLKPKRKMFKYMTYVHKVDG